MASQSFRHFVEQKLGTFPHFVVYAILEWVLIILLYTDGFLSFLCNEFAKFFELQIPCLLCTRIDHILIHRNPDFYYNDAICEDHKRGISSLAYCHMHRKLSDIKSMCEGCLLSFATEKESDCETHNSLVGILHKNIDSFVDEYKIQMNSGRRDDVLQVEKSSGINQCSCCGEALKMRPSSKTMARNSSINGRLSQAPAPSPRAPTVTWKNEEARHLELPHIRYTELKFMLDNESELQEDEDAATVDNQCEFSVASSFLLLLIPLFAPFLAVFFLLLFIFFQELKSHSFSSWSECDSPSEVDHNGENERHRRSRGESRGEILDESSIDFEQERSYLLGLLTNLEKKINSSSDDGTHSSQSNNSDMVMHEDAGQENKVILTREVSQIREGLRAIEADSGFLKHAAMTLQKGDEGTKLLTEIAHHLRKIRQLVKMPPEEMEA